LRSSFAEIRSALALIECEEDSYSHVINMLRIGREGGVRLFFIGNGGSAAISSHMSADYQKNGNFAALAFNDPASLTCISNDIGYDRVFALPIEHHGRIGDILFAVSSSGESASITKAVAVAQQKRMNVITLSGFNPNNALRKMGGINFYVPSDSYGTVEICHLAILHSLLDEIMALERPAA